MQKKISNTLILIFFASFIYHIFTGASESRLILDVVCIIVLRVGEAADDITEIKSYLKKKKGGGDE